MRKSEIVIAVIARRSATPPPENQVLKSLSSALKYQVPILDMWDRDVDPELAKGIIRHISSVRGDLTMHALIRDIDIILDRMACGSLSAHAVAQSSN